MSYADVRHAKVIAANSITLLDRIKNNAGSYPTQATTTSISVTVLDVFTNTTVATLTPAVSTVISDTLVTNDARWTEDTTGYNAKLSLAGTNFPNANTIYRVTAVFTPTSGDAYRTVWELQSV